MKKILTILLLFACLTSFGQFTGKWSEAQLKLRITRGGDMMWFYFDADGSAFYRATERINIMPYNRILMVMDSNVVTLQNTKLRYTGIQTTTGKTYYLVMDGDSIKKQVTSITESDPVWAADSAKVLHWADTLTKIATQYDISGFLSVETDPVFAADSAKVLHFADTLTKIATRYNLDTLETVDYWNVQNNLSVTGDILCDAYYNTKMGTEAGAALTTGNENTAIGYQTLYYDTSGNYNTAIGAQALIFNTSGSENTAVGVIALEQNLTGSNNTAIGLASSETNLTGNNNTSIGYMSLAFNAAGNNNTATGNMAGYNCLGSDNVFMGDSAGYNETGSNKLYIANSSTATPLIYGKFPNDSLKFTATTSTFSGALNVNTISPYSGTTTTFPQNVTIRKNLNLDTCSATTYGIIYKGDIAWMHDFRHLTGNTARPTGKNIFIGVGAGNFTMGSTATTITHASFNTGIGSQSLFSNTTGSYNAAVGIEALYSNTTGLHNYAMGYRASYANQTGSYNAAIGSESCRFGTYPRNTAVGYQSLYASTTGYDNVGIGYRAGRYLANGATANETSNTSIYIGSDTRSGSAAQTNEIVIGCYAIGNNSNTVTLGSADITGWYATRQTTTATAGTNLMIRSSGATSGSTDKNGGNISISSGIATGNNGSDVIIQSVAAGQGTGTTDRAPVTAATFSGSNVAFAGNISVTKTITPVGTTGNQTINHTAGRVNIAATDTMITVTNSLVTANSIIMVSVATNDATCTIKNVVAGAGSFVIKVVATTAETAINFLVIN